MVVSLDSAVNKYHQQHLDIIQVSDHGAGEAGEAGLSLWTVCVM